MVFTGASGRNSAIPYLAIVIQSAAIWRLGTQWQVFLAGLRQKSSIMQVLSHWLQIGAEDSRGLTRAGQNRSALDEVFSLSSLQQRYIDCLLYAGHWVKQRTDSGEYKHRNQDGIWPYGPGKYTRPDEAMPEHVGLTPKA